ncbi:MAG: arginine--tRNA ligase [Hyphomicrobiaceae bacterium]|nr:arginine--tRNA ligase [Hyphomicrobiaceae bacterium]
MNALAHIEARIATALESMKSAGTLPADLETSGTDLEPTRDPSHGDLASNAAMVLAKPAGLKPRDIAERLKAALAGEPLIVKAEIAGPGFLNLTLAPQAWQSVIGEVLAAGSNFGRADIGKSEAVNVEYVSANPTGPMHVGHCRGAVFGDALASLLDFAGWKVTREYYINDAGAQVDVLARSVYLRYLQVMGEDIEEIPEGLYPGDYLIPVAERLAWEHDTVFQSLPETHWLPFMRRFATDAMLVMIKEDLAALNVKHDVFFSERSLTEGGKDEVAETIAELRAKGLVFEGRLERPKGHDAEEWEDREQTLFKATDFGDDVDRALMKSDGSYTYFAADMAYHHNKLSRGFRHLINVFGADHSGYIKRMKAAVKALSGDNADLDIKVCQLVRLLRAGEPVKMSKRAGTFVTLREVVDEVGRDPVRFMMLYRKNDATLDFDLARVVEQSKDNPVFYVQYAHARVHSVFRQAREALPGLDTSSAALRAADIGRLDDKSELELMRRLALWPRIVAGAARAHEPHRIAFYLHDVASLFHSHWTRGNDSPYLRFIQANDPDLTLARLALAQACAQVIASGLAILGVEAPTEMR